VEPHRKGVGAQVEPVRRSKVHALGHGVVGADGRNERVGTNDDKLPGFLDRPAHRDAALQELVDRNLKTNGIASLSRHHSIIHVTNVKSFHPVVREHQLTQ
jgi:hypothetical protein